MVKRAESELGFVRPNLKPFPPGGHLSVPHRTPLSLMGQIIRDGDNPSLPQALPALLGR